MSNTLLTQVRKMKIDSFPVKNPILTKYVLYSLADRANDDGYCWPSVATICEELFIGRSTFFRKINELEKLGFVKRVNRKKENSDSLTSNFYFIYLPEITLPATSPDMYTLLPPVPPRDYPRPVTGLPPVPPRDTKHQYLSIKETYTVDQQAESTHCIKFNQKKDILLCEVREVFEHWKIIFNTPTSQLDTKRKSTIEKALKTFKIDQLKEAIEGCAKCDYNMENGHTDIELICRNNAKTERFIRVFKNPSFGKTEKQKIDKSIQKPLEPYKGVQIKGNNTRSICRSADLDKACNEQVLHSCLNSAQVKVKLSHVKDSKISVIEMCSVHARQCEEKKRFTLFNVEYDFVEKNFSDG